MINNKLLHNLKVMNPGVPPVVGIEEAFLPQDGANLDSWFYIGRCKKDGRDLNFLLHFILIGADGMYGINTFFSCQNKVTGFFSEIDAFIPLDGHVGVEDGVLRIATHIGSVEGNMDAMHLKASNEGGSVDVVVQPRGFVVNNGGTGYYPILTLKDNFQFSMPYFTMSGTITIDGEEFEVVDESCWLDRQYDWYEIEFANGGVVCPGRWTWHGIMLENKTSLSVWDYTNANGITTSFATVMGADGVQSVYSIPSIVEKADEIWTSEATGNRYPTHWLVDIPQIEAKLEVTSIPQKQEIVAPIPTMCRYEGESIVTGTLNGEPVTGDCCVELMGDWSTFRL
ncbi:MAG: hypothetical protein IJO87_07215 [Eggerthellaceae bacterium]|nr:hypothetical protein [Eggerthellaceae bacterium]